MSAGLFILIGLLVILLLAALPGPPASRKLEETKDEIRRIGDQARRDIRRTRAAYEQRAKEILSKKR